ncbi:hypothetical protein [Tritonibacter mobilis]|uniref:Uncharacterized protein n=1 Tax=Tritonibacter mobilis F1926 TaxID=1265309 RepID=A0A1B1A1R1_9RHOB|nr:hypothetical protein [Tritonibacter mobilis]ANP40530.1 hypothetical protein K529_007110 [Tritonibacter mobilis F1926]KJZ25119.1 hypothetical protein TW79_05500 [Tritonibacter mobilis]
MLKSSTARGAIATAFNGQRRIRQWRNNHFGSIDAVKIWPLSICRFRPDEGGTVSTNLNVKLAPVSGYMRSNAYVEVVQVFVPYQAIEKLWYDTQDDAGVTEMTRRRLIAGITPPLDLTNAITNAANIHPRKIGGDPRVSSTARTAYNAAVNHLRRYAYYDADQLTKANASIVPAILSANALERFNGVLEPERNIDGAINLTGELPLKIDGSTAGAVLGTSVAADGESIVETTIGEQFYTDLSGTGEITLRDMIRSQILDGLIRNFAQMIEDDPINGEGVVERALYGLSVDYDDNCQVLYKQVYELSPSHARPMDGASFNDVSAHFALENETFTTLVPRSELGGQLVTLVSVKPLETVEAQPDPAQTETWELVNRVHDEMALDEVLLTRADLESGVLPADEDQPVFWTGHNSIKHAYSTRGVNKDRIAGVEMKSSMWTYPVPSSVTPENISYPPGGIDMYPFYNWNGGHAEYTIDQVAAISTHLAKGPNPVERIQIFAADPSLIENE